MCAGKVTEDMLEPEKICSELNGHRVEAEVLPQLGSTLVSFKVDDRELIYFDKDKLINEDFYSGCFMMFPTPCRLTEAKYTFEDKIINQTKYGQDVFIHGLVRDESFDVKKGEGKLECSINIDKNHPVHQGYPFPCRLSFTFEPQERALKISFKYENTGDAAAPFGYGLHPFWRIPGQRKDTWVQIPCDQALELENLIPTGQTKPIEGTNLDFRSFTSLEGIDIDNAFWGRDTSCEQAIEHRGLGIKITLESSDIFEHMIAYAPAGEPFVCMENLTCTPDAPNVYAKGFKDVSGFVPGQNGSYLRLHASATDSDTADSRLGYNCRTFDFPEY